MMEQIGYSQKDIEFERYYAAYYWKAIRYAARKVQSVPCAEDLTQTAFLYCYQNFEKYKEEKASFGTWFFLVLNSRIKNFYRQHRPTISLEEIQEIIPAETDFDTAIELEDSMKRMQNAMKVCSAIQEQLIKLRYFDRKDFRTIGQQTGLTEGNVRTQLSRALKKIRLYVEKQEA